MFDSRSSQIVDFVAESGQRGDAAFLRLSSPADPHRWAVVSSPGDRWFSIEVDGGFSLDHFEEGTRDEEVIQLLSQYMDIAVEYLRQLPTPIRGGLLRTPIVKVAVGSDDVVLHKSLSSGLKGIFMRRGRP